MSLQLYDHSSVLPAQLCFVDCGDGGHASRCLFLRSDGGAAGLFVQPGAATSRPSATNPLPVAGGWEGGCADGICEEFTTQRQVVYQGCGANPAVACQPGTPAGRDVYNYSGKQWDPYNCSSANGTVVGRS